MDHSPSGARDSRNFYCRASHTIAGKDGGGLFPEDMTNELGQTVIGNLRIFIPKQLGDVPFARQTSIDWKRMQELQTFQAAARAQRVRACWLFGKEIQRRHSPVVQKAAPDESTGKASAPLPGHHDKECTVFDDKMLRVKTSPKNFRQRNPVRESLSESVLGQLKLMLPRNSRLPAALAILWDCGGWHKPPASCQLRIEFNR